MRIPKQQALIATQSETTLAALIIGAVPKGADRIYFEIDKAPAGKKDASMSLAEFAAMIGGVLPPNIKQFGTVTGDGVAVGEEISGTDTFVFAHTKNTREVQVTVRRTFGDYAFEAVPTYATSLTSITVQFTVPPLVGEDYLVTII